MINDQIKSELLFLVIFREHPLLILGLDVEFLEVLHFGFIGQKRILYAFQVGQVADLCRQGFYPFFFLLLRGHVLLVATFGIVD